MTINHRERQGELLSVRDLSVSFLRYGRGFRRRELHPVRSLHVAVRPGELVAVAGSSGSGKSLLAHSILGLLPRGARVGGKMAYRGEPLTEDRQRRLRGREIVLVPQSVTYLDPLMKVGPQVRRGRRDPAARQQAREALGRYGLGPEVEGQYPFALSGGMIRRALISTAAMESPRLVIADEPTPGLHRSVARRVLGHFREMADEGAGVLLITHDLELALTVADRIVVLYAGTAVEEAPVSDFAGADSLRHPYTRALWRAMPEHGFHAAAGEQPGPGELSPGCLFAPRCEAFSRDCRGEIPWRELRGGYVRCIVGNGGKTG